MSRTKRDKKTTHVRRKCRCFLNFVQGIYNFVRDDLCRCVLNFLRGIYNFVTSGSTNRFLPGDNGENDHLLPNTIYVTASVHHEYCRNVFNSFQNKYLESCDLRWTDDEVIDKTTIVFCPKISRLQDDIKATLNAFEIQGVPYIMLVVIHYCEPSLVPENLLNDCKDRRVTRFTNILYCDSKLCFECQTNKSASDEIKKFIQKNRENMRKKL
ncbi:uncharacterized protein LOC133185060 [Saccostrea echinata]|uniref:uncharacterized protein LOC133185060 n=1 Tax=Saccostrea echinata TaxID=191078 RepID=UPI002A7F42A6|nr:uncharacterized protein LOC133185060 [Saccostrea echinata]